MRKWTYLVAALLMGGVSTSLTSCIDNDEPYGIEQMRTAKAEFYAAQAAYKTAEIEYLNAQTQLQQYLAEEQNLRNETLKLQNDLLSAKNEDDKARLALALEEANAAHAIAMKNYETAQLEAEAAYQTALKNLDIVIARLNSDYRIEYSRILASITANRAEYSKLAADLVDAKLDLAKYTEQTLDTASVRGKMVRNIERYTKELDLFNAEKDLLTSINGADESEQQKLIADLDKEIREKAEAFNVKVAKKDKLNADKTTATTERTNKVDQLRGENAKLYVADKTATVTVDPIIQHEFITVNGINANEEELIKAEELNPGTSVSCKYYTLADAESKYSKEVKSEEAVDRDDPGTPGDETIEADESTTSLLIAELQSIQDNIMHKLQDLNNGNDWTADDWAKLEAKKAAKDKWLADSKKAYEDAWKEFNKDGGVKKTYDAAALAYRYDNSQDWYEYAEEQIKVMWTDENMESAAEADKKAVLDKLLPILKDYAAKRIALDGWAYAKAADQEPLYKSIKSEDLAKEGSIITTLNHILNGGDFRNEDLKSGSASKPAYKDSKTYDNYAYGAYTKAATALFGSSWSGYAQPDVATEYNRKKANLGYSVSFDGLFGAYQGAYADVQAYKEAEAWKGLYDQITKLNDPMLADIVKWTVLDKTVEENADVVALQEKIDDLQDQIDVIEDEIGSNATTIAVKANGENIDTKGTTEDRINSITIVKANDGSDATLTGTDGDYLSNLVTYHNSLRMGNTQYSKQIENLTQKIEAKEAELVEAKQLLAQFDNGGWEVPADDANYNKAITIADANRGTYYTYKLEENGSDSYITITTRYPDGRTETIHKPASEAPEFEAILASEESDQITYGNEKAVTVTTTFLKVIIKAYEGKVANIEQEMKDLDAELSILQKEQEQFLAKIEARYNAGGNPEETPAE